MKTIKTNTKTVPFRRKREGKTNYPRRMKILISSKLRLAVRFTGTKIIAQLIEFQPTGDKVLVAVDSSVLKKMGWNYSGKNFPAAYLTGLLIGKKSMAAGHTSAIFDVGQRTPLKGGKVCSFFKGVLDSGLDIPCDPSIFPSEERIRGVSISSNLSAKESQFTQYLKNGNKPEDIPSSFDKVKEKILAQ